MNRRLLFLAVLIVALVLFSDQELMAQCAMCKKNLESNLQTGGSVGKGINKGILYLMAVPYLLLASVIGIFFRKQLAEKWTAFRKGSKA